MFGQNVYSEIGIWEQFIGDQHFIEKRERKEDKRKQGRGGQRRAGEGRAGEGRKLVLMERPSVLYSQRMPQASSWQFWN